MNRKHMLLLLATVAAVSAPPTPGAAPSWRSNGAADHKGANLDLSLGLPDGKADDDVILNLLESDNSSWVTADAPTLDPALAAPFVAPRWDVSPAGAFPNTGSGTSSARVTVGWARGSAVTATITQDGTEDHTHGLLMAFKDVKLGADPFGVNAVTWSASGSGSLSVPGITTPSANCRVVYVVVTPVDATGAWITSATNAGLTDIAVHYDNRFADGTGGGLAVISGVKATAGASGNLDLVLPAGTQTYRGATLCLEARV